MRVLHSEFSQTRPPERVGIKSSSGDRILVNGEADARPRHQALIDHALPRLATDWQKSRLILGDHGNFPPPAGRQRQKLIALDLVHSECPSLTRLGESRITLAYNHASIQQAQGAFLAAAAWGGWPVAGDHQSLALLTLAQRIAASDIPVLLEGPTGTGKEVLARFVHRMSPRADGPFVAVNCAAMPESMLEGLLFGHTKGAFTGAGEAREGLFRAADGGTLLLDEIGELPLALQSKLLRALQEGEVLPLGSTRPITVDVRIVAATNRTLSMEVEAGRFREDLLYRLNVFPMELAALRQRSADIAPLAFAMLLRHACEPGKPCWITGQALALLETHVWPGNVRELENVIRRAILLAGKEGRIGSEHIVFDRPVRPIEARPIEAPRQPLVAPLGDAGASLSDVAFRSEAQAILKALDHHGGHRGQTARSLGISERTLRYRLASMRESGLIAAGGEA